MLDSIRHRGPDGEGTWEDPQNRAALIHARLSILDLSELGAQPMSCGAPEREAGGSRMVMNGEIFNFRALREDLEASGETFTGNSDTEVVIRLLTLEGKLALPKLAGMFALAWYDTTTGHGLLARDPFGIKPLYYTEVGGAIAFASEVKALLPLVPHARATAAAVRDTLLWGSMPGPRTFFDPIRELPPGSYLEWDGTSATVKRWYTLRFGGASSGRSADVARAALVESVERHLVSDVPVGIFLSGGIDSTAVLALARQCLGRDADLRTFSIGFADPEYDESSVARRTAAHFGARHTEWIMTSSEGQAEIGGYLAAMDQPTIDGFNTWCVSKLARREGIKVVLSGLGGDELFGGYDSFRRVPQYTRLFEALGTLRPLVAATLDRKAAGSRWRRLAGYLRSAGSALSAYHVQRGIFTEDEARTLALSVTGTDPGPASWHVDELPADPADAVSQLELTRYMLNQLLRDSDVFAMAHGLELRVPLVDARLFESVAMIPSAVRLGQGKRLLLEAVPEIPAWVREQPKRGFRFPLQNWIENGLSEVLDVADEAATVPLVTWYRRWALATVMMRRAAAAGGEYQRLTIAGGSFRKVVRTAS